MASWLQFLQELLKSEREDKTQKEEQLGPPLVECDIFHHF